MNNNEAEIINPSDKAFCSIDDWMAACVANLFVGNGKYGLESESKRMPIFIFGGYEEWFLKEFSKSFEECVIETKKEDRLKKALLSFRLSGRRSSMNNFVGYAHELAGNIISEVTP